MKPLSFSIHFAAYHIFGSCAVFVFMNLVPLSSRLIQSRRRSDLLLKLKEHCQEENKKADSLQKSEINFFYLPLDFK